MDVFYVPLAALRQDPALAPGGRGLRKLAVTAMRSQAEEAAHDPIWRPPITAKCPVLEAADLEISYFNEHAPQDRHYHKQCTEIYTLVEGTMRLEVRGKMFTLAAGDMAVVGAGAPHRVLPDNTPFLCRVIAVHCGGRQDKYTA